MSDRHVNLASHILTILVAGVFIIAGALKWNNPAAFEVSLLHLDLFPQWLVWPMVSIIPLIEVLAGLMCLSARFSDIAIPVLLILTTAYTLLLFVEWLRGISPGCGCFGSQSAHWPYWALFARNLGLLALEAFLIHANSTGLSETHHSTNHHQSTPE